MKVSDRKNSILLNPFYSGICIQTKQFHFDLIRSRTKDSYTNESEPIISQPKDFYPNLEFQMILEYYLNKKDLR